MTDQEIKEKAINDVATAYGIDPERLRRFLEDVPYNAVLSPPTFKPTLDEKKMREILESSEMHSRFNINEYLEQTLYKLYFEQGSVSIEDLKRKRLPNY